MNLLLVLRAASRLLLGRVVELGGADLAVRASWRHANPVHPPHPHTRAPHATIDKRTRGKPFFSRRSSAASRMLLGSSWYAMSATRTVARRADAPHPQQTARERSDNLPNAMGGEGGGGSFGVCGSAMNREGKGALHSHSHFVRWNE